MMFISIPGYSSAIYKSAAKPKPGSERLKISARGHHSMEVMVDLAVHYGQGPLLARDIAMRNRISEQYLVQLFVPLRIAQLVTSYRGAKGGYQLARSPSEIKISEIVAATEGSASPTECAIDPRVCWRGHHCIIRGVWQDIERVTDSVLGSMALDELVQRRHSPASREVSFDC